MKTPVADHPAAVVAARSSGFGFATIMARRDRGQFRRWYDRASLIAPGGNAGA
jgi:hypothetical protein